MIIAHGLSERNVLHCCASDSHIHCLEAWSLWSHMDQLNLEGAKKQIRERERACDSLSPTYHSHKHNCIPAREDSVLRFKIVPTELQSNPKRQFRAWETGRALRVPS
eukprot:1345582-Amphidinium_carterae.1